MKASIAVLCLLGVVSSENLSNFKHSGKVKRSLKYHTFAQLNDHENDTDDVVPEIETNLFLQINDHENDTEDIIPDSEVNYIQLTNQDHENDTDDIPGNMDPMNVHLRDSDGGWLNPDQVILADKRKKNESSKWDQLYQEEDDE